MDALNGVANTSTALRTGVVEPDVHAQMRQSLSNDIDAGFSPPEWIWETAVEIIDLDETACTEEELLTYAKVLFESLEGERRVLEQTWPAITDNDRLDTAFAELEANGIVARQNFACCTPCAWAEIGDEIEQAKQTGQQVSGCVFFHSQATDHAREEGKFYLSYGADKTTESDDAATITIGERVTEALSSAGLTVEWNGDPDQNLCVTNFTWQKRWRPTSVNESETD